MATKLDLKVIREVDEHEGVELAKKLGLDYFQVSTVNHWIWWEYFFFFRQETKIRSNHLIALLKNYFSWNHEKKISLSV